ncbi:MAG TPA: outer membrane protein [Pseudolabrys sp.]|nr:outer membrane protein [Pseudolabrys sp.]
MTNKTIIAMAAATLTAGSAAAADLPRGPAPYYPPPSSIYNWTGPYAGLNVGYEWSKVTNTAIEPSGVAGGGQLGYNWQISQFVFGAETDIQASAADDTFAPYKFSNPWFGTLRGRAGFAINNMLLYGTFGLAYGELKGEFFGIDENKTHVGWTGGAGLEVGFAPSWSAKVEYLYMDLGNRSYTITGTDNGLHANYLRLGVNYHF